MELRAAEWLAWLWMSEPSTVKCSSLVSPAPIRSSTLNV